MKPRRIFAAITLVLLLTATISTAARQIEPVTLYLVGGGPLDTFDPLDDVHDEEAINQLYLGLTSLDPADGTIQPAFASEWQISPDGLTWRFTLRDDVPWVRWNPILNQAENVQMVTAGDVVYGIGRGDFDAEISARAVDDVTLEITLSTPDELFLNLTPSLRAMPQDVIESLGEHWTVPGSLVTNGPFVLDEWIVGVRRVYLRNPLFPQDLRGPGNVQRVIVDSLPEDQFAAASAALYQKGIIDITRSGDDWLIQPWITGDSFDSVRCDWITIDQAAQLIARRSWSYPTPESLP